VAILCSHVLTVILTVVAAGLLRFDGFWSLYVRIRQGNLEMFRKVPVVALQQTKAIIKWALLRRALLASAFWFYLRLVCGGEEGLGRIAFVLFIIANFIGFGYEPRTPLRFV